MNVSKNDQPKSQAAAQRAEDAFVSMACAYDRLAWGVTELLREYDLSMQQFNALRILRGARPERLPCQEIASRMLNRDPDVTRLIDRLEKAELVERERSTDDRRVILVGISRQGLERLAQIDAPLQALHERQFADLKANEARALTAMLQRVILGNR